MDEYEENVILQFMILTFYIISEYIVKPKNRSRKSWVREANLTRELDGYFSTCFEKIKNCDPEDFFKHTRMNRYLYDLLLNLVKEDLTKLPTRKPYIGPEFRLAVLLSYLSQGVPHQYLAWSFKIGKSTTRKIILETCDVLWKVLSECYVSQPNKNDFKKIAADFEDMWDLPNCVGAIDGKHIPIIRPAHSGSNFYNYKSHFSIVLLAACDAKYCFTAVDVGAYGSQSDGGILANSPFGTKLLEGQLPLPNDRNLPKTEISFPYYFVGDPAFPLKKNVMRAYPGKLLSRNKRVLNYILSRARVVIENSFGILVARWRILQTTLNCRPENAEKIVLACIALHNFIKLNEINASNYCPPKFVDWEDSDGNIQLGDWRNDVGDTRWLSVRMRSHNASRTAFQLRNILMDYCNNEGAILKQQKIK